MKINFNQFGYKENRINSKKDLKEWIEYEGLKRRSFRDFFPIGERHILKKHQLLLRKTEYYLNTRKIIRATLYRMRLSAIQNKYALHIPPNTCGKGLQIMHIGPILLNGRARVGENCALHINTALVAGGNNDETPVLGNNIVVGIGAVIVGGVTIADGVAIGANAVVNKDILDPNITVAGVPAKKISNNSRFDWNKMNTNGNTELV